MSQRHGQSQSQRDTHSHSHSHRDTVTAGCLLLYRNLPVSIPNSNYVYARRYFFAFWPPCCIRFQLVWPYLTEKCAALDITIARFHCIQRVPNKLSPWWYVIITSNQADVQGGIWKGYCHATRHRALVKVASQAQLLLFFFSESARRLGIGNWIILHFYSSVSLHL